MQFREVPLTALAETVHTVQATQGHVRPRYQDTRVTARNKHNHSRPHAQLYQVLLSLFTLTLELSTNLRESFCNVVQSGEGPC